MNIRLDNVFINKTYTKLITLSKYHSIYSYYTKKKDRKTKISIYNSVKSCHKMFIVSASSDFMRKCKFYDLTLEK